MMLACGLAFVGVFFPLAVVFTSRCCSCRRIRRCHVHNAVLHGLLCLLGRAIALVSVERKLDWFKPYVCLSAPNVSAPKYQRAGGVFF
jgi:hypothetical protein